ncbi:hypothetical protein Dda_6336 [Drechslerella dactyloides]|uniref:F-box domain-containing protein n=1 Tax=Drechslerella dactyloides TaxID=74499 RepID=A0AAD6IXN4_DREDA|nr:hypothetical protein Dda_6336 [Drechslerella dactyloides]
MATGPTAGLTSELPPRLGCRLAIGSAGRGCITRDSSEPLNKPPALSGKAGLPSFLPALPPPSFSPASSPTRQPPSSLRGIEPLAGWRLFSSAPSIAAAPGVACPFMMDRLPPEILLQIFKHFDAYTVLKVLRPVCKSFSYACAISIPSLKIVGLSPALWERVLSDIKSYRTLHNISRCDSSFHELVRSTNLPTLQAATFRLPLNSPLAAPTHTSKVVEHPAFENICCRIELGSLIYHKTGNSCPTDLLAFPVADDNATNPPVDKVLVKFSARYGVILRPVLVTKGDGRGDGRGVTVGDVYRAMKRLFVEPLTEKQAIALKELRDWENRKHEAVKKAVSKIERDAVAAVSISESSEAARSSSDASGLSEAKSKTDEPKEPIIEHDESEIFFEQPIAAEFTGHPGDKIQRQREFLYDFPYVYASAHMGGCVNGTQVFVLTYH